MLILFYLYLQMHMVYAFWQGENHCPISCTCRLQHITETNVYRFTQQDKEANKHYSEANIHENNDVYYDEDFLANFDQEKSFLKTVMCVLQTETAVENLLQNLPKDINTLALIQGSDSGIKTIKLSQLLEFHYLTILELQGVIVEEKSNLSTFTCEIDVSLPLLEYLNLEKVELRTTRRKIGIIDSASAGEFVTFNYAEKISPLSKPLTFIRKEPPTEILPYNKYIEQNLASFKGFSALILLRISNCDFNSLHWEMFEGLNNLIYMILEKNNLKFIPDFAFYGTANVKTLSLAHNNLLNIQIRNLAGLLELEYLDLSYNNFSQLSELSLPPFPKLKLANFADNPISAIFPNTFEVMNTTDSIVLGGEDTSLSLLTNSFLGLKLLKKLTIRNLKMRSLEKEIFVGMPNLNELVLTGDIPKIEFDAFLEVFNLENLILNSCNISKISIDAFMGLNKLKVLDLSRNNLEFLAHGVFEVLTSLRELYLNNNKFKELPAGIFSNIQLRLIRLNNNPWHCNCDMSDWRPVFINRIKQKTSNGCNQALDKGIGCSDDRNSISFKYLYENRVAPKCSTPKIYENWNAFHVLRKQLKCSDFKPKIRKAKLMTKMLKLKKLNISNTSDGSQNIKPDIATDVRTTSETTTIKNILDNNYAESKVNEVVNLKIQKPNDFGIFSIDMDKMPEFDNNLNSMNIMNILPERQRRPMKRRYRKKMYRQNMYGKTKKVDM